MPNKFQKLIILILGAVLGALLGVLVSRLWKKYGPTWLQVLAQQRDELEAAVMFARARGDYLID